MILSKHQPITLLRLQKFYNSAIRNNLFNFLKSKFLLHKNRSSKLIGLILVQTHLCKIRYQELDEPKNQTNTGFMY